jgi:hypothetical protein
MNVGSRIVAASIAGAVLSLVNVSPVLAVSQSSGLTIRITRPSAATVNLASDPLTANGISGSLTPSDSRGTAGVCAVSAALEAAPDISCTTWNGSSAVAFTLPLEAFSGFDVVASAS